MIVGPAVIVPEQESSCDLSIDTSCVSHSSWLAVFTNSRHEKKVAEHCQYRGIERFLPVYASRRLWKNRQTVSLEIPLFPCYLFVRVQPQQRSAVLGIPGVISIVGRPQSPSAVPDQYITMLRTGVALQCILPHPQTAIGDRVRIISGPLAGIEGILARVKSDLRVVVSIELIRQSIAIEVSRYEIEPVTPSTVQGSGRQSEGR